MARTQPWGFPWERLSVPVLIVTGPHDRVFYIAADVAELTARISKHRTLIFADAGHPIPIERPRAFAEAPLASRRRARGRPRGVASGTG